MNTYENLVILNASLSDEEIETASGKIKDLITNGGGEILKVDAWGRKRLAYEIKKQKRGFYVLYLFRSPSSVIKKLEDYYKVFDPVVKFLVLKLDKAMMKRLQPAKSEEKSEGTPAEAQPAAAPGKVEG